MMQPVQPDPLLYRSLGGPASDLQIGARLDHHLSSCYPFLTRNGWQKRIDLGEVLINGLIQKASYRLRPGDQVHFYHPREAEPEVDTGIRVLWQEGSVMAVFKPGNLPMHENGAYRKNTFATLLGNLCGKDWSAVHRLDRETSGIVLCSSKPAIRQALADMFEAKTIQKEYLLIAAGVPKEQSWSCQGPLGDLVESQIRIKKWVVEGGLPSSTDFILEETCHDEFSLIRAFPRTGRTNQIRIHAAYSGHWILGDKLYNPDERVFLDYWENGTTTPLCIEKTHFHRLCLHAASLTFTHPETRKNIEITSPLPEDLQDLWYSLGRSRYTENAQ